MTPHSSTQPLTSDKDDAGNVPAHHLGHRKRARHCDSSDESDKGTGPEESEDDNDNPSEDLQGLHSTKIAQAFDDEAVQWDDKRESGHNSDGTNNDKSHSDADADRTEANLTKRAVLQQAELLEFSDGSEEDIDIDRPKYSGPHNAGWPRALYLPARPGQRNICINVQPVPLSAILKDYVKCLIRDCAFKHGYIPLDRQRDCLVRILIESAVKLDKGDYTLRCQKDPVLQGLVCDLLNTRVSLYRTNIKRIASYYVLYGYSLIDKKSDWDVQVARLLNHDFFIFEPYEGVGNQSDQAVPSPSHFTGNLADELELPPAMVAIAAMAVHASLDEKVTNLEFNADTYEDTYNTHIKTLKEIREKNPPGYYRLMSNLFKLAFGQDNPTRNPSLSAVWLLDMDGMAV
ncbi:hypothetical protein EI94DRAFT_1708075 [Lactarius quietus]|nr:hypothetical protein EI94DRAFT_1708075 [Lactarius quietus]